MQEVERYGDLTFYTLSSGTVISLHTEETRQLLDWFSIPTEDIDGDDDNEGRARECGEVAAG